MQYKKTSLWLVLFFSSITGHVMGQTKFLRDALYHHSGTVLQTADSSYLVSGYMGGGGQSLVSKFDVNGNTLWQKLYNTSYSFDMKQASDGGFILTGRNDSVAGTNEDALLIKADSNGSVIWAKTYGSNDIWSSQSVDLTFDGGYILAGFCFDPWGYRALLLIKVDQFGDILWAKTYGKTTFPIEYAASVKQTLDSGYIAVGTTFNYGGGNADVYVIKTNMYGDTLWTKAFGGAGRDEGEDILQTSDGGYIIVGSTSSFSVGAYDVYVIKINSNGNLLWSKTYGGSEWDFGYSIKPTSDAGFIIAGQTQLSPSSVSLEYLIKIDSTGNTQWSKSYNFSQSGQSAIQSLDGGYILAGYKPFLTKTDSFGNTDCNTVTPIIYSNIANTIESGTSTAIKDTTMLVTNTAMSETNLNYQLYDVCVPTGIVTSDQSSPYNIYPNPGHNDFSLFFGDYPSECQIIIYTMTGVECMRVNRHANEKEIKVNFNFEPGIYIVAINNGNSVIKRKLIVE